jgi:uncharacterized protein GlcG (DUF336 family)
LETASANVDKSLNLGKESGIDAICVVVLDSGGHPVASKSQDGCGILRFEVAFGKAYGALGVAIGAVGVSSDTSTKDGTLRYSCNPINRLSYKPSGD